MIEGKTKSGFEYSVSDDVFDDYELLENLSALTKGEDLAFVSVMEHLLSEDQRKALKDHLRKRDGMVRTTALTAEAIEIFQACKSAGKNS